MVRWTLNKKFLVPALCSLIVINIGLFALTRLLVTNFYFQTLRENVVPLVREKMEVHVRPEDFFVRKGVRMQPSALFLEKIEASKNILREFAQAIKLGALISVTIWDTYFTAVTSDDKTIFGLSFPNEQNVKKAYRGETLTTFASLNPKNKLEVFKVYLPIKDSGANVLGVVELDYDASGFKSVLARTAALLALSLSAGIIALAAILTSLFRTFLLTPIKKLRRATRPISQGEIGAYIDIAQRDEIGDLADDFNRMIRGLNNLSGEVTRLKQVDRLKSEFVSVAAHQLRTPLSAINWALEKLMREKGSTDPDFLTKTYEQSRKMTETVHDLLNAARIEETGLSYKFGQLDLISLINNAITVHAKMADLKRVTVAFNHDAPSLMTRGDPQKLDLVVSNLLTNAIEYTPDGGSVTIDVRADGETLHIVVRDSGVGIDPEDIPRVFTKFFRGSRAVAVHPDGLGIGLFISKSIIEAHRGTITLESSVEHDHGTSFSIRLPRK